MHIRGVSEPEPFVPLLQYLCRKSQLESRSEETLCSAGRSAFINEDIVTEVTLCVRCYSRCTRTCLCRNRMKESITRHVSRIVVHDCTADKVCSQTRGKESRTGFVELWKKVRHEREGTPVQPVLHQCSVSTRVFVLVSTIQMECRNGHGQSVQGQARTRALPVQALNC